MADYRTFDGRGNNQLHPEWGSANQQLLRLTTPHYVGRSGPVGSDRPNPRVVSNIMCLQEKSTLSAQRLSDFVWAWGQFLDHELDLTEAAEPAEPLNIAAPENDPKAPGGVISFVRSVYDRSTGTDIRNPRQQINQLSSYIDGANVYGADATRAAALRTFDGTGKLKCTASDHGPLLPYNLARFPNALPPQIRESEKPQEHPKYFLAGDIRANEHAVLTSMHTLFLREHNRLCDELVQADQELVGKDEELYQRARKIVGALMQVATFEEFLPALLGPNAFPLYAGYNPHVNTSISNIFSTACYRLGHSMLSEEIQLVPSKGKPSSIKLREAFFTPQLIQQYGIDGFLAGLASQVMQEIDTQIIEEVRSFLFNVHPTSGNMILDLAALNIQRGRDHGLPDYNQCRKDFGLPPKKSFADISSDKDIQKRLESAYSCVDLIDPWVGGLRRRPS